MEVRQELVRVLGILGAIDPFKMAVLRESEGRVLRRSWESLTLTS